MSGELNLRNDHLQVRLDPDRGADILSVTDRRTGVQLLYRTPWADAAQLGVWAPDSRQSWVAAYRGGWQLLSPNAGDAATRPGGTWGFHGEACLLRWTVQEAATTAATLSVRLSQAPLRIKRRATLEGPLLRVHDTFHNESPEPVSVSVLHHPAFGAPLVTPGARLRTGARTLRLTDRPLPGLEPGTDVTWPAPELLELPPGGPGQAGLGFLTDFTDHWAAITSADDELGVALAWSGDVLPHAWLWLEANATAGMPWYRSEYVLAVEPASTIPATGVEHVQRHGGNLVNLAPGSAVSTTVVLAVHHDPRPVTGMSLDGRIRFEAPNRAR